MRKLIDADAFKAAIKQSQAAVHSDLVDIVAAAMLDIVDHLPDENAAPKFLRCCFCKYAVAGPLTNLYEKDGAYYCKKLEREVGSFFFCGYGKSEGD